MSKQQAGELIILGWDNAPGEGDKHPYTVLKDFDLKEEFENFGLKEIDSYSWGKFITHLKQKGFIAPALIRQHVLEVFIDEVSNKDGRVDAFYEGYVKDIPSQKASS